MARPKSLSAASGAVASEHPLASDAGCDVLRHGGNAFDAAVATSFSLAVTSHHIGGMGGDFFGMYYDAKTGRVHCLNASGWSPSGLSKDIVVSAAGGAIPRFGPLSSVIPGYVSGVCAMHKRFGSLELEELLRRPLELASEGFPASDGLCRAVRETFDQLSPPARRVFAPRGSPVVPGELIKQPEVADVIGEIAESGSDSFYRGRPSEQISAALTSMGVECSEDDFRSFSPEWVEPISFEYRGTRVYEVPPNSMGATTLLILKLLSRDSLSKEGPLSSGRIAKTMAAVIPAYSRRDQMLGDPRFQTFDFEEFMSVDGLPTSSSGSPGDGDTTAFSVVDREGNVVSGIQSLFFPFGSRVFIAECGVFLSNRGSGFALSGPNMLMPRKRPLHTLSSLILERDGRPRLSIGTSGGDFRPNQHALFVTNSVDYAMGVDEVVAHPRFLWNGGNRLLVEAGYETPGVGFAPQALPMPGPTGVCQAVELTDQGLRAVCDVRGDGLPAGF